LLVITGSAGLHDSVPSGVDIIKLPSVGKQGTSRWRPHSLDIQMEHLIDLRRTMIAESIRAYDSTLRTFR
jgi:predicted glycosyltransferase